MESQLLLRLKPTSASYIHYDKYLPVNCKNTADTHFAPVKEGDNFLVEFFLEFLLRVDIVAVPLQEVRDTWFLGPLVQR